MSPQFYVHDPEGSGWNCQPDLVAIDFKERVIYLIEVSGGRNGRNLAEKVVSNFVQAAEYVRENLKNRTVDFSDWPIKIRVFLRQEIHESFLKALRRYDTKGNLGKLDIQALELERTLANWTWWDRAGGKSVNSLEPKGEEGERD